MWHLFRRLPQGARMRKLIIGLIFLAQCIQANQHFVVIIPSYNNEQWCEKNIDSVLGQKYDNFHVIYIDDCSCDRTYELVSNRISYWNGWDRVTLIRNEQRMGAAANWYNAINMCLPSDIIVLVDGDDALVDDGVLAYLDGVYSDPNVWVTYGQFKSFPRGKSKGCAEIPAKIFGQNTFRKEIKWPRFPSHLRTFYAGLAHGINEADLMYEGVFVQACTDLAILFPICEKACKGHTKFISKILYEYNMANSLNMHKVNKPLQHKIHIYLTALQPYEAVDKPY